MNPFASLIAQIDASKPRTANERRAAIIHLAASKSQRAIAREIGVSRTTVYNTLKSLAASHPSENTTGLEEMTS